MASIQNPLDDKLSATSDVEEPKPNKDVEEPKPNKKVADRPHWITIVIGIFSPTVGICALIISLMSLRAGERSLKIGQQAYLAVYDSTATIERGNFGSPTGVQIVFRGTIKNLGNTPARITLFRTEYKDVPADWKRVLSPFGSNWDLYMEPKLPGQIPPKDKIEWTSNDYITMNLDTFKNLQDWQTADAQSPPAPRTCTYITCGGSVTLRMEYEDVFHQKHEMQWTESLVDAHICGLLPGGSICP